MLTGKEQPARKKRKPGRHPLPALPVTGPLQKDPNRSGLAVTAAFILLWCVPLQKKKVFHRKSLKRSTDRAREAGFPRMISKVTSTSERPAGMNNLQRQWRKNRLKLKRRRRRHRQGDSSARSRPTSWTSSGVLRRSRASRWVVCVKQSAII